ncbi:MAG: hypothetical protein AAF849_07760 [Bacteroidota bacterium]
MTHSSFFTSLFWLSLFAVLLAVVQQWIPAFAPYLSISWMTILCFTLLTIVMYFVSSNALKSGNNGRFMSLFMGFTMLKMLFAVCIIVLYHRFGNPATNLFVFPFFLLYLIYTFYEVWFMTKLGRMNVVN